MTFTGVKVFSATMQPQREAMSDLVTNWIAERRRDPRFRLVDIVVSQSSDESFHMISIVVFFAEEKRADISTIVKRPTPSPRIARRTFGEHED